MLHVLSVIARINGAHVLLSLYGFLRQLTMYVPALIDIQLAIDALELMCPDVCGGDGVQRRFLG
jgi:hypothetical protein